MASKSPSRKKTVRKNRKKRSAIAVILSVLLVLLLMIAGAAAWITIHSLNKIQRVDTDKEVWIDPSLEDFEEDEPEETPESNDPDAAKPAVTLDPFGVQWKLPETVAQNDKVHNILLIGQDRRPGEGRARSDSMIICSVNEDTNEIRLCSLMRDMYVPFPGGYSDNRINAAYTFGGMSLLDQLIEEDLGIPIEGNVEVDFDGFLNVMGLIAPLEIELNDVEAWYLNNAGGWMLHTGVNALNAEQLLLYARVRSIGHADYDRTERQRKVVTAAFNKIRTMSVSQLTQIANAALPCVTTDLSNSEILNYVYMVGANRMSIAGTLRIPADGTHTPQMIRGMSVLLPDLDANSTILREFLYQ